MVSPTRPQVSRVEVTATISVGCLMSTLAFEEVSHAYGRLPPVKNVSLRVNDGGVVCLLGPSGCGKTTLLRLAAGLENLQRGRVLIYGEIMTDGRREVHLQERTVHLG